MTSKITRALVATAAATSLTLAPAMAPEAHAATTNPVVAKAGASGSKVSYIQTNLHTLGFYKSKIDGHYGPTTTAAVKAFQKAEKLTATGIVDQKTYNLLVSKGTAAIKAYRAKQAAAAAAAKKAAAAQDAVVAKPGSKGLVVKQIQGQLNGLGYLPVSAIVGTYGPQTTAAVKAFQKANGLSVTGIVNVRTRDLLVNKYNHRKSTPAATVKLDRRCLTGRVVCVNKTAHKLYWVINGSVKGTFDVRTGRPAYPTREGQFAIYLKSPNWWSTLYNVYMPYSQFFSGGEAVHYSVDFATNGYGVGSHGCVNMNSRSAAAWLYSQTRVGDKVVVYH